MKVLLSGGGTGGHIAPLLSVISALKEKYPSVEIVFVGSKGGIEEKLIPQADIKMCSISSGKFRRYHKSKILNLIDPTTVFKNMIDFKRFLSGIFDSLKILKNEEADVVFLKGGYVSLPLGLACRIKGYPYFIHESDVVPGLANRILEKGAQKVFVSYEESNYPRIDKDKLVYSGNPVRKDILKGEREMAYEIFGFKKNLRTILVMGGSQGAHAINELIAEKLESYTEKYQLIHIAGDLDYDWLEYKARKLPRKERYKLASFFTSELASAYSIADLVISRAGNNVLTELAALKKPTVIIPLESSANDHQLANARVYSRQGAAYVMLQSHLSGEKLFRQVSSLLENPEEMSFMSEKFHQFYKDDAADIIAGCLISFYKGIQREKENARKKSTPQKNR